MTACPQRYASIESAPTMKENDLMNCSPGDGSRRFKRAVMESRPSTKCASSPAVASGDAACGDLSRLDDDVIIDIIAHLLLRPISSLYGRKLNNSVKDGLTDVLSLPPARDSSLCSRTLDTRSTSSLSHGARPKSRRRAG